MEVSDLTLNPAWRGPGAHLFLNSLAVWRARLQRELTQTSQDEKTLNLNVILLGPQRIHCVWIQKDIPGCERGSFLFSARWPPPSLSKAACLSLTTAACCLWRLGASGAAPDICRPWAWAAYFSLSLSLSLSLTLSHSHTHVRWSPQSAQYKGLHSSPSYSPYWWRGRLNLPSSRSFLPPLSSSTSTVIFSDISSLP